MFFFFFKQKTAYEMRISDWSSDVCSSDLVLSGRAAGDQADRIGAPGNGRVFLAVRRPWRRRGDGSRHALRSAVRAQGTRSGRCRVGSAKPPERLSAFRNITAHSPGLVLDFEIATFDDVAARDASNRLAARTEE